MGSESARDQWPPIEPEVSRAGGRWRWGAVAAAAAALLMAAHLGWTGLESGRLPPGCGEGDGCAEVLTSHWARLYGVPVAWGGVAVYAGIIGALVVRWRNAAGLLSTVALGSVAWFVVLQAFVLFAFCAYCMVDHTFGALAAGMALVWARPRLGAVLAGVGVAIAFAGLQAGQPFTPYRLQIASDKDADLHTPDGRWIFLLDGELALEVAAVPRLGRPDARQVAVVMVDYACVHCRTLHHDLARRQAEKPDELAVIVLPTPIHPSCNPLMTEVADRFRHSCEIAALSLGMFHVRPEVWIEFDTWLFEPSKPRSLDEVRARVREAYGLDPDEVQSNSAAREELKRNVDAFAALPVDDPAERRLPVLMAVGHAPVVGPAGELDQLDLFAPSRALEAPEE